MIYGLTPVQAARAVLERIAAIEINALLQIGVEVVERRPDGLYTIRMGRHTFTSRSDTPLKEGHGYWAQLVQTKEGIVQLKRLHPKPLLLQKNFDGALPPDLFSRLRDSGEPMQAMKEQLLQALAHAPNKESFQNLTQLLLSLHAGVLTIPWKREGRPALLQMRQSRKEEDLNRKRVEFYTAMNNLGPIEGTLLLAGRERILNLSVHYPRSVALLERRRDALQGFDRVEIVRKEGKIAPFWDATGTSLLDIKG